MYYREGTDGRPNDIIVVELTVPLTCNVDKRHTEKEKNLISSQCQRRIELAQKLCWTCPLKPSEVAGKSTAAETIVISERTSPYSPRRPSVRMQKHTLADVQWFLFIC